MSKFLFVSSYDLRRNTSSNIRTIALMEALASCGCDVDVAYIQSSNQIDEVLNFALSKCCTDTYKLIEAKPQTTNTFINNKQTSFRDKILKIYSKIFIYDVFQTQFKNIDKDTIKSINNKYDYIVSSSEPRSSHKLAKRLIKVCRIKAKWIQYFGDPMTNDVASNKFFPFLERHEEKKLLKKAWCVLYTNPGCERYMRKKYPFAKEKIFWIPTSDIIVNDSNISNSSTLLSYVGDYLSKYRNILPLYNACLKNDYSLTIAGNGDIDLISKGAVNVLERVNRIKATQIEYDSNILVVLDNDRKGREECIQVPGKLYHYALTNKYIIVVTNSKTLEDDYKKFNRFVFCANNEKSIDGSIKAILNNEYGESFRTPLREFSQNKIVECLMDAIKVKSEK